MSRHLKGIFKVLVIIAILLGILRLTILDVWIIPNDLRLAASTAPTLGIGDVVVVLTKGTPGFGDLVRCPDPDDTTKYVVGRIASTGGDAIEIDNKTLKIGGKPFNGESACSTSTVRIKHPTTGATVELACDVVRMGGGWHYRSYLGKHSDLPPIKATVPPGRVYLLSDDRDFHDDSRDYGAIPATSCTERIVFRLWSGSGNENDFGMSWIH